LEEVLMSPEWFGLQTASPGQRALCRMSQGYAPLGDPLFHTESEYSIDVTDRCNLPWMLNKAEPVPTKPTEVYVLAGIRCGKSLIAAAVAVYASQTVDVSALRPGEKCRFSILSLDKDKARAVLMHLYGAVEHSVKVRQLVVGEVRVDGVDLRHPSGTIVEIRVAAGKRAGGGLVSYWSAGVVFDEAPRMLGEEEGVVNFSASRKAVLGRLLPGAQLWAIGSPWAPMGPVYAMVESFWGKPGHVLVLRAPAPALNPVYWTPSRCEAMRLTDPDAYRMDVLGEWGTPEQSMFTDTELREVLRDCQLPPEPGVHYYAAMDPATRGNAWTLVIGGIRRATGKPTVYLATQWLRTDGMSIGSIVDAVRDCCVQYGVEYVRTDQWSADAIIELGRMAGISIVDEPWQRKSKVNAYDSLRVAVRERKVELHGSPMVMQDLLRVKRVLTQDGVSIKLPETMDGRHCDYAPAIAMWASMHKADPSPDKDMVTDTDREEQRMEDAENGADPGQWTFRRAA
jgi:hypothetical protein